MRIIAGTHKGRKIRVPAGAVRPTPERVREALFSILGETVRDARVLDAYSGSGALGFEALSRGAAEVVFLEAAPAAATNLRRTASELGLEARCRVQGGGAIELVRRGLVRGPFRLVLADPPYATDETAGFLALIAEGGLLSGDGRVVLEREARSPTVNPGGRGLILTRSCRYGRTRIDFYDLADPS